MCDSASDFSDVKVGDRLWSFDLLDCMVTIIDDDGIICCENDNGMSRWYNQDGTDGVQDRGQSLFWSRPIAPPRPKRKVTKTVEAWAEVCNGKIITLYSIGRGLGGANIVHLTGSYEVEE